MMGMMGMSFSSVAEAIMLVALGIGYIVCYLANREDKALRTIGYIIGMFIMASSIIFILNNLILSSRACREMGAMKSPQRHMMMKGQMFAPAPAPAKP